MVTVAVWVRVGVRDGVAVTVGVLEGAGVFVDGGWRVGVVGMAVVVEQPVNINAIMRNRYVRYFISLLGWWGITAKRPK